MPLVRAMVWSGLALAAQGGGCLAGDMAAVVRSVIYPGQQIEAAMVTSVDATNCYRCIPGFISDPEAIVGMIAVRTVLPDRLIYPAQLRKPAVLKAGQPVSVLLRLGALSIFMRGETLADANVGDTVAVRNKANGVIVTGTVAPDGSVLVDPS